MDENNRPPVGHEEADVNVWAVGKFAFALLLAILLSMFLLFGLFRYFHSQEGSVAVRVDPKVFPEPRLQSAPIVDLKEVRAAEDSVLNSYGWVDAQKGIVRIPIDRAIDLLAQRNLPARPVAPAASDVTVPTAAGLGPKMQGPGGPLAGDLK